MEAATEHGNEKAMIHMFEKLDGEKSYKEAYRYAKKLSEAGNHEGTKRMADYYYEGKGVSRDRALAKDLYYDAAGKGNKAAKEKLMTSAQSLFTKMYENMQQAQGGAQQGANAGQQQAQPEDVEFEEVK